jgi:hypothetical protein
MQVLQSTIAKHSSHSSAGVRRHRLHCASRKSSAIERSPDYVGDPLGLRRDKCRAFTSNIPNARGDENVPGLCYIRMVCGNCGGGSMADSVGNVCGMWQSRGLAGEFPVQHPMRGLTMERNKEGTDRSAARPLCAFALTPLWEAVVRVKTRTSDPSG